MALPSRAIVHRCKDYRGCTREIQYRLRRLHLRTTAPEPERTLDTMISQRPRVFNGTRKYREGRERGRQDESDA